MYFKNKFVQAKSRRLYWNDKLIINRRAIRR